MSSTKFVGFFRVHASGLIIATYQGRIQNLHCRGGGAQVTNEAEGM